MDIEASLRELLVLENPGARFTDGVMARVGHEPVEASRDGVVRFADARARKRGRRIVLGLLLGVAAAASTLTWFAHAPADASAARRAEVASGERAATDAVAQAASQIAAESNDDAKDPLQCIDPDVLYSLLLQVPGESFRMSAASVPELADFKPPRQLALVGSTERSSGAGAWSTLVYRTNLAPVAAGAATAGALSAGGWRLQASWIPRSRVFTTAIAEPEDGYCREGRSVRVATSALDGVTYVVLTVPRKSQGMADAAGCDQPAQSTTLTASALDPYLPKLALPDDPSTGQPAHSLGAGDSNGVMERRMSVSFRLDATAADVAAHFTRQMAEQGWRNEASWSSAGSAGSSWNRSGNDDEVLQATLTVAAFDAGRFTVNFHVVTTK